MTDDVFERIDLDKATEAFKKSSFNETTRTNVKIGEKFISFAKHHIIHKDLLLKEENIFSKLNYGDSLLISSFSSHLSFPIGLPVVSD